MNLYDINKNFTDWVTKSVSCTKRKHLQQHLGSKMKHATQSRSVNYQNLRVLA